VFSDLASHSIAQLMAAGAFVTINTDDPPMFSTTLTDEYLRVAETFALDITQVSQLVVNGINASFLPAPRKRQLRATVENETLLATERQRPSV
jgi:aminodeoxyfutalosine deaminase